jgi:hypothetical protein
VNISHADTGGHPKAVQQAAALTTQARGERHCAPYHPLLRGECYTLISRIVAVVFVTGGRTITRPLFQQNPMPQALEEKGSLILSWSGNDAYSFGKVRVDRSARAIVVTKENWVRFAKSFSHSKVVLLNFARFAPGVAD